MKLRAITDIKGIVTRNKGDEFDYDPWEHYYQGASEQIRRSAGCFVHCYGHGEFEVLLKGVHVQVIEEQGGE